MNLNFRQGIVSGIIGSGYLLLQNNNVSLIVETIPFAVTAAHGRKNYFVSQKTTLNNLFSIIPNVDTWFYIDVNTENARITYGSTNLPPTFGNVYPINPQINQNFYDKNLNKMFFFSGETWIECIRVFIGSYESNTLKLLRLGTQVDDYSMNISNEIIKDNFGFPIKIILDDGSFGYLNEIVNYSTIFNVDNLRYNDIDVNGIALDFIPRYYCVCSDGNDSFGNIKIKKTSYFDIANPAFALTIDNFGVGELKQLLTYGYLQDFVWSWTQPAFTPLFVGGDGEITTKIDNPYSIQQIGHIVNASTIFIDFQKKILLNR